MARSIEPREIPEEGARLLRATCYDGTESLRLHGPQLESEEFEAFLDAVEAEALR